MAPRATTARSNTYTSFTRASHLTYYRPDSRGLGSRINSRAGSGYPHSTVRHFQLLHFQFNYKKIALRVHALSSPGQIWPIIVVTVAMTSLASDLGCLILYFFIKHCYCLQAYQDYRQPSRFGDKTYSSRFGDKTYSSRPQGRRY